MAAKKDKGFGDIGKGLRKNPALLIALIVGVIVVFVLISNRTNSADAGSNQGLPNGSGSASYLIGLGNDYATGGPWDSFFKKYPGSYHSHKHHVTGKSHHDHGKGSSGGHNHKPPKSQHKPTKHTKTKMHP